MCDDLFDESVEDQSVAEQSWQKTINQMNKAGYREGLDAGKEEVLQDGFNKAFSVSSQLLFKVAELRGKINGKLSYSLMRGGRLSQRQEAELQDILLDVVNLESDLLQASKVRVNDWLGGTVSETEEQTIDLVKKGSVSLDVQNSSCACSCEKDDCSSSRHNSTSDKGFCKSDNTCCLSNKDKKNCSSKDINGLMDIKRESSGTERLNVLEDAEISKDSGTSCGKSAKTCDKTDSGKDLAEMLDSRIVSEKLKSLKDQFILLVNR